MADNDNVFDTLAGTPTTEPVETTATPATSDKKAKIAAMKKSLIETMNTDPEFTQKLRSLSESLEVVNSLGFGDSGNIIVDTTKSTKEERALTTTSVIVGYRVRNIGSEGIGYQTEVWTKDESGKYVAQMVDRVLAPGAYCDLTREYMTRFCAQPEISFQLANGKVVRGSGGKGAKAGLKEELEAYYFTFSKDADGNRKQINSDEVKLNVGEKGADGKWHVKDEFVETFGYLENAKESTRAAKTRDGKGFNASDLAANFVMQMIKGQGM